MDESRSCRRRTARCAPAVAPACAIHVETSGSDPAAMRRAIDAGVGSVTVRIGSALG